ncbi:tyrosine-protein kinase receptor svh-2 [Ditylenchus destructor]|nr:tyrosine-protein kinase receptor svh-2 [Ditylenchus destructor]
MRVLASHNSLFDPHDPFITASTSSYEPPLHRRKTIHRLPPAVTVNDIPKRSQFSKMTSLIFSVLIFFALFSSTQCHSRSLNDTGQTLISFDSGYIVHSIATYGDILAVENGEAITVFRLNRTDNNEIVGHHKIYEVDLTSESGDIGPSLLELKLVSANTLLFCTQTACRVCNFAEGSQNECTNYSLQQPNKKVKSVKANLLNDGRLIIRTICSPKGLTSIYMLDPSAKQGITQNTVVFAFGSDKHTYFVGSSKKVDVPWSMVNQVGRQVRMDIRMSRVCNLDGTSNFESRIDIALSCKGLDDGYFNSFYHIAKAASLSNDGKRLLVAMQNGTTTPTNTVICEYDTCKSLSESSIVGDPKCFLYSWEKQWRYPICERFNKNAYNKTFDNCDLASSELNVDRNGWLENYKPVLGEMVAMFENGTDDDVVGVKESFEGEALFVTYESGIIKRISMEGGKYTIVGKGFSSIRNLSVLACGRKCDIILPMDTVIRCSSHIHTMCPISLTGQLGDLNSFTLMNSTHVPPEGTSETTPGEEQRNTHSKMIRVFGFIVVVVLLLGTLVCVWHSYRKYSKRISAKLKNTEKGQHPTFVDTAFSGHLNDSGELDQSRIHMLKHIGDGRNSLFLSEYIGLTFKEILHAFTWQSSTSMGECG